MRHLHPADHHQARIGKVNRMLESEVDFEDMECPAKIRDIQKIEKLELHQH